MRDDVAQLEQLLAREARRSAPPHGCTFAAVAVLLYPILVAALAAVAVHYLEVVRG